MSGAAEPASCARADEPRFARAPSNQACARRTDRVCARRDAL